jgi:hypothetical protein
MSPCTLRRNHHGALGGPLPHFSHLWQQNIVEDIAQSLNPYAMAMTAVCSLVDLHQSFVGTYCLHVQGRTLFYEENGGTMFPWNVGNIYQIIRHQITEDSSVCLKLVAGYVLWVPHAFLKRQPVHTTWFAYHYILWSLLKIITVS